MTTLYDATVPVLAHGLGNLRSWLQKSERYARDAGIPAAEMLESRLAPDMFTLTQQVQYAYFTCLEAVEHLSGRASPEMGYDEKSVGDLYASLDRVVAHLESIQPGDVGEATARTVETFLRPDDKIPLQKYIDYYALPNFYFHTVTAYGILRHKGVPLGKADYIG